MKGSCLLSKGRGCSNHQEMQKDIWTLWGGRLVSGQRAFSLLALHNLEVKLLSDHHGTATLLSCSFIWDGIAALRKKAAACPSQGPGTLNFSDSIQLRKALCKAKLCCGLDLKGTPLFIWGTCSLGLVVLYQEGCGSPGSVNWRAGGPFFIFL